MTNAEGSPPLCDQLADDLQEALARRIVQMIDDNRDDGTCFDSDIRERLVANTSEMIGGFIDRHYGDEEAQA